MDESVTNFFTKNADQAYIDLYDKDHGPRLDELINHWNLKTLKNKRILDVGGGLGFLGKRLDADNDYWVFDGAKIPEEKKLCKMTSMKVDLDYHQFSQCWLFNEEEEDKAISDYEIKFDVGFCLEVLEHLTNPYNCLAEMKKMVVENGYIYISIPHFNVTHNYIYPALMWTKENFQQFLEQMALPVEDYFLWDKGWNAHTFKCRNAPWTEAKMLFPKHESKFYGKTPVEYVNL